jgi:hypothetical protein
MKQQCTSNVTSTIATINSTLLDSVNGSITEFKRLVNIDDLSLTAAQQIVISLVGSFEDLPRQKKK